MENKTNTYKRQNINMLKTHKNKSNKNSKIIKQHKINIKQKGGEKVGEGGYGCVVKPSIPCKPGQKSNNKYISKIILNYKPDDYNKELEKLDYVKNIDKTNKYCISYIEECELDMNILKRRPIKDIIKVNYTGKKEKNIKKKL